jgi:hypothetical protein
VNQPTCPDEPKQEGWLPAVPAFLSRCVLMTFFAACLPIFPASAADKDSMPAMPDLAGGQDVKPLGRTAEPPRRADFKQEAASPDAQELAHWVVHAADNRNLPFIIIDKVQAKVFVFERDGQLRGAAAALLGLAIGDDTVPGIGQRKLSSIRPDERTTPAGRFVASLSRDVHGEEVLWVDYDSAVSLHRVVKGHPKERRAERLASPTPLDNRISYGCINVPVKFYEDVVSPAFKGTYGIVYILPETRPARQVFGSYAVEEQATRSVQQ